MDAISYTAARTNLAKTMEQVCEDHSSVIIARSPMCQRSCRLKISEDNYAPLFTGT